MKIKNDLITKGFLLSGLMNISGVLIFSRAFSNGVIAAFDNQAMSNFGLLMIIIWGIAFISVAKNFHSVKLLIGVFAIEKFIYATHWTSWMINNNLKDVWEKDKMAGIFYAIYGINDWVFFIFFSMVFIQLYRNQKNN
jgi:hypothetical protein